MIATGQAWNRQVDVIFVFAQLSQSDFDGIVARGNQGKVFFNLLQ